jgi:hypothetical protein
MAWILLSRGYIAAASPCPPGGVHSRAMNFVGGFLIIALGLFIFGGGYYQWPWFMNNSRARFVATILSRTGARIFYMALGVFIAGLGVAAMFSDPPPP